MSDLRLTLAVGDYDHTRDIINGKVPVEGIELIAGNHQIEEIFFRFTFFKEWDVSELSMGKYCSLRSQGDTTFTAIPVFISRQFRHSMIYVREGSEITQPGQLKGKRIGVPEYQQTSAVWSRGVLQHEFGVQPTDVEWFMERGADRSHGGATGFQPPPGVRLHQIPPSTDIGEMMIRGELDATLLYLTDRNLVDRSRVDVNAAARVRTLFADHAAEFYLGSGNNAERALELALLNLQNRATIGAYEQAIEAAKVTSNIELVKKLTSEFTQKWGNA